MSLPELPITLVREASRRKASAVGAARSPFTGTEQVQDWGGEWWEYDITLAIHTGRDGKRVSAFFAALGSRGAFLFRDPSIANTPAVGTPTVNGAGQAGNALVTDGWTATGLLMGDFFALGTDAATRLYQITADVVPAAGAATIAFTPKLRAAPADNTVLEIANPKVALRLVGPVPAQILRADKYQFTFSAREAI